MLMARMEIFNKNLMYMEEKRTIVSQKVARE